MKHAAYKPRRDLFTTFITLMMGRMYALYRKFGNFLQVFIWHFLFWSYLPVTGKVKNAYGVFLIKQYSPFVTILICLYVFFISCKYLIRGSSNMNTSFLEYSLYRYIKCFSLLPVHRLTFKPGIRLMNSLVVDLTPWTLLYILCTNFATLALILMFFWKTVFHNFRFSKQKHSLAKQVER